MQSGRDAQLPPHLSLVLGLGNGEQATAVKQIATQVSHEVHAFNVCAADHGNLVIFSYSEESRTTVAFLLAPAGTLRKAVSYVANGPTREMPNAEARTAFAREREFWSQYMATNAPAP
jgi:hypothetical protein